MLLRLFTGCLLIVVSQLLNAAPVQILEKRVVEFYNLTNENGICTMADNNRLTGSNGQTCSGKGKKGKLRIKGDVGATINISVLGSSSNGVTFRPRLVGPTTLILETKTIVFIVGELELLNAPEGPIIFSYDITANYE